MKQPSLLLVNPWIYDFKAFDFWMKPLGLLYVASILEAEGYMISFIDCLDRYHQEIPPVKRTGVSRFGCGGFYSEEIPKPPQYSTIPRRYKRYGMPEDVFSGILSRIPEPDAILVTSMMTYWYPGVFRAIEMARENFPRTPIILGGIYSRICPGHAREFSGADHVVSSIDSLLEILGEMTGKKPRGCYDGFSAWPAPLIRLLGGSGYIPFLTSLGCPFRCTYCASGILFPRFVQKEPRQLAAELASMLGQKPAMDVAFYDDALLADFSSHLGPFLAEIRYAGLKARFHAPNALHARYINNEVADLLKLAGFETIRLGLEFSAPGLQKDTGGKVTTNELEEAIKSLFSAGFQSGQLGVYVLCGVPGQTFEDVRDALSLIYKCGVTGSLAEYSPIPGTKLAEELAGLFPDCAREPLYHNNTYHIYQSTAMPFEEYRELKQISLTLNRQVRAL